MELFVPITQQMFTTTGEPRLFTTTKDRLSFGPPEMQTGDIVVGIYGIGPVLVLREKDVEVNTVFEFVSDGFVHGLMELSRMPVEERREAETVTVI
jgi:hypothetical protein